MEHYACGESARKCSAVALAAAALLALGVLPGRAAWAQEAPATQAAADTQTPPPTSAPTSAPATGAANQGETGPGTAKQSEAAPSARGLFSLTRPGGSTPLRTATGIAGSEAIWRMLASMIVIIVLGLLCYVMVKRVMPRLVRTGGRSVRILETACLERGQRVHVLGVGTEKYLVASGRAGVTVLANVTQALGGEDRPADRTSSGGAEAT